MWATHSPSGRYEITIREHEAFNTHWVLTPGIKDKQTGEMVFDFENTQWSLDEGEWRGDSLLKLTLRKYPGNHQPADVIALIDCEKRTGAVGNEGQGPLDDLEARLDRALTWIYAEPAKNEPRPGFLAALQRFLRGY